MFLFLFQNEHHQTSFLVDDKHLSASKAPYND